MYGEYSKVRMVHNRCSALYVKMWGNGSKLLKNLEEHTEELETRVEILHLGFEAYLEGFIELEHFGSVAVLTQALESGAQSNKHHYILPKGQYLDRFKLIDHPIEEVQE